MAKYFMTWEADEHLWPIVSKEQAELGMRLGKLIQQAMKKGKILFVGTKHNARELVRKYAEECGMPYVNHRWLGGTLTNYRTVRYSVKKLQYLETQFEKQNFFELT